MNQAVSIRRDGATAIVTLDRKQNRNALSQAVMAELTEVAEGLRGERDISTVVLTGTQEIFSAGVDLKDPARWEIDAADIEGIRMASERGARMCRAWESIPQLTIAAVEGLNVGGGIALTLCCDWRIHSETARLRLPEAQIGIPLSWQTVPRLVNLVGPSKAKQLILRGKELDSQAALELGLVDLVVPPGTALEAALEIARDVNRNPRLVITMTKQSVNNYANALAHLSTHMDVDQAVLCGMSAAAVQARRQFSAPTA
ncbi:enoyl-CoA hydratase/isomerase family protein [Bordetella genomosp. 6]|uniref:enoyl-CoA hydratase/isomerase family protein n=1 Tax=Bordetella genomosp. 6 TaxID=463024 RepID=UPI000A2929AF|nr:enoyl-CoA hydratase/isomerase family protein [Bordetella genomosp. 6]ARP78152.1 enoyl-CoA hydratase [Bordetella genomosp. 6]